jgi:hypothetical protein
MRGHPGTSVGVIVSCCLASNRESRVVAASYCWRAQCTGCLSSVVLSGCTPCHPIIHVAKTNPSDAVLQIACCQNTSLQIVPGIHARYTATKSTTFTQVRTACLNAGQPSATNNGNTGAEMRLCDKPCQTRQLQSLRSCYSKPCHADCSNTAARKASRKEPPATSELGKHTAQSTVQLMDNSCAALGQIAFGVYRPLQPTPTP